MNERLKVSVRAIRNGRCKAKAGVDCFGDRRAVVSDSSYIGVNNSSATILKGFRYITDFFSV